MTDSSKERDDLIRRFEDTAHEIHGDATEYLAKRDHDGFVEYVRGDVNSSWVFFKAGSEDARQLTAKEIADWLDYANEAILLPADKYKCVKKLAEAIRGKYGVTP